MNNVSARRNIGGTINSITMNLKAKGIIVVFGLIWGLYIGWFFGYHLYETEYLPAKIALAPGALPVIVAVEVADLTGNFGGIIAEDWDNTPNKRQIRGMLYIMISPPIYGVLITYSLVKIYALISKK